LPIQKRKICNDEKAIGNKSNCIFHFIHRLFYEYFLMKLYLEDIISYCDNKKFILDNFKVLNKKLINNELTVAKKICENIRFKNLDEKA